MARGRIENLRPQNTRTKAEQRKIARKGGKASGKARAEKKKLSQFYAEALAREYDIEIEPPLIIKGVVVREGKKKRLSGQQLVDHVFGTMLGRCDMVTAKLLENIGDFTEGKKVLTESTINVNTDDTNVAAVLAEYGISKTEG